MTLPQNQQSSAESSSVSTEAKLSSRPRLFFIDNLRILLTVLVILHHIAITYGAPGSWYYNEGQPGMITTIVFTLFVAINQSFFMGFFFMISGYFNPASYDRKGVGSFLKDRLLRLGIPILFFLVVIDPLLKYYLATNVEGFQGSFGQFISSYFGNYSGLESGPMWFVHALLMFTIVYAVWRWLVSPAAPQPESVGKAPSNLTIAAFALILAVVTFVVRIWLPFGWNFELLNMQFPYFPQYIALFVVGTIAYKRNWFTAITDAQGKLWLGVLLFFIIVVFPLMLVLGGALEGDFESARGGLHWQSLAFSIWEQVICMGMVISLLVWFRNKFNSQGNTMKAASGSAYTAYILQAPVGVVIAVTVSGIVLYPILKFAAVGAVVVTLCFILGNYIRKLPLAREIL